MKKSTALFDLLATLTPAARERGLTDSDWAARAGLRKETLSRMRRRSSCDFASLVALAGVVGMQVVTQSHAASRASDEGHFPARFDRALEERLLELCASRTLARERWAALGPAFFMAGLAMMLASVPGYDRRNLLALAEELHPGSSEPAVFALWLQRSPLRPSRFLPMLEMEMKHAA
jgi:hypothetical protein